MEKAQGFGGSVVQRSPSLIMVVFGLPQTLEQLPQRAAGGAGDPAVGHRGGGPSRPGALPHGATGGALGLLLVEAPTHQPAARLLL